MLYACDWAWWHCYRPSFAGLRVTQDARVPVEFPDVRRVPSVDEPGLSLDPYFIHTGGNSGFQALNLAILLGAREVVLLGFDMKANGNQRHWHDDHPMGMNNPRETNFTYWRRAFSEAADQVRVLGVPVINCSRDTALDCFPRTTVEDMT